MDGSIGHPRIRDLVEPTRISNIFPLLKTLPRGNCHKAWYLMRHPSARGVFARGGVPRDSETRRQKCRWHRHRTGLSDVRLFETFETPWPALSSALPRYPSADRSVSRSGETPQLALPRYPATSPAENGPRYFPVILTVTSGNRRIQDLVVPMARPVFLPLSKTLPRGNYRKS